MQIADTLSFLLGSWRLERTIEDHRSGARGSMIGTVRTEPDTADGRASYLEEGELLFGGHRGPASRRLGCTRLGGGGVLLSFADGHPFVEIDLTSGAWDGTHDCRADRYEIATVARSPDVVEERWRVRGPDKDYDAVTTLTRSIGRR